MLQSVSNAARGAGWVLDASLKKFTMLDTAKTFETPEGVALELHVAGPVVRAVAWFLDALIRAGLYIGLSIALVNLGGLGKGVLLICFFLIEWFYPVIFEVLKHGATPGKKTMGIQVVHDNGTPVSWSSSIIRNLLRVADFAPLLYGFGLVAMLLNQDFKRLGDMAAGTIVIYRPKRAEAVKLVEEKPVAPLFPLSIAEQRAVLEFSERSQLLSQERRVELASIVEPLTGQTGEQAIKVLYQNAVWLHGSGQTR